MKKREQALAAALVVAVIVLGGWIYKDNHKPKPVTAAVTPVPTEQQNRTTYAKGINLVMRTYDEYRGDYQTIKDSLSPELYQRIANEHLGHDPITCGQMSSLPATGGNPRSRVSVKKGSMPNTLQARVDSLTEENGSYYYSEGPTVTVDQTILKITSIDCPAPNAQP